MPLNKISPQIRQDRCFPNIPINSDGCHLLSSSVSWKPVCQQTKTGAAVFHKIQRKKNFKMENILGIYFFRSEVASCHFRGPRQCHKELGPPWASVSPSDRKGLGVSASLDTKLWRMSDSVSSSSHFLGSPDNERDGRVALPFPPMALSSTENRLERGQLGNHQRLKRPRVSMGCRQAVCAHGPRGSRQPCCWHDWQPSQCSQMFLSLPKARHQAPCAPEAPDFSFSLGGVEYLYP